MKWWKLISAGGATGRRNFMRPRPVAVPISYQGGTAEDRYARISEDPTESNGALFAVMREGSCSSFISSTRRNGFSRAFVTFREPMYPPCTHGLYTTDAWQCKHCAFAPAVVRCIHGRLSHRSLAYSHC